MSAFVVNKETIEKVICGIQLLKRKHGESYISTILGSHYKNLSRNKFANQLWAMNSRAVNQRYTEQDTAPEANNFSISFCSLTDAYKATQCFIYQCSEGDVPSDNLFKKIDQLKSIMAETIVEESEDYDKATWG